MIEAIVTTLNAGYDIERKRVEELGFKVGDRFEVEYIRVGRSSSTIGLVNPKGSFNSVFFEFEEDGAPLDIYRDKRFDEYSYF